MKRLAITTTVAAAVVAIMGPVHAEPTPAAPGRADATPEDTRAIDTSEGDYVLDELFTADGERVATTKIPLTAARASGPDAATAQAATASGGSSSASGCRKTTISNRARTVLGFTAYRYNTWTYWCWDRAKEYIKPGGSNGWSISDTDGTQYWRGEVRKSVYFYDAGTNNNRPRSAFRHYRQGSFENCVVRYGCLRTSYPANSLRSYYNGTYTYAFSGT